MHRIGRQPLFIPAFSSQAIRSIHTGFLQKNSPPGRQLPTSYLSEREISAIESRALFLSQNGAREHVVSQQQLLQQQLHQAYAYQDYMRGACHWVNYLPTFTASLEGSVPDQKPHGFDILYSTGGTRKLTSVFTMPSDAFQERIPVFINYGQRLIAPAEHFSRFAPVLRQHIHLLQQHWRDCHQQLLFYGCNPAGISLPGPMAYPFHSMHRYHSLQGEHAAFLTGYPEETLGQWQRFPADYYFQPSPSSERRVSPLVIDKEKKVQNQSVTVPDRREAVVSSGVTSSPLNSEHSAPLLKAKKHPNMSSRTIGAINERNHLNPSQPLSHIFSTVEGENFQDTVDHKIMVPTPEGTEQGLKGKWHVKKPRKVSVLESAKRKLVNLSYSLRNRDYKAKHYSDTQTLVEKEVLAGKISRHASVKCPSFASQDWQLEQEMHFGFCSENGDPCVGCQHISHKHLASKEKLGETYDGEHNPATAYVFRRYFLGDEDGVKKGNYLIKEDAETGKHAIIPIDYGLAFFNKSTVCNDMGFSAFLQWSLKLPPLHRLHYTFLKPEESIMPFIETMTYKKKVQAVYMALIKIAAFSDSSLSGLCAQISDPRERVSILGQLRNRTAVAKRLIKEAQSDPDIQPLLPKQ